MIGIVDSPVVLGHRSFSFLEELSLPGERPLLIPATDAAVDFVAFCFGLYEQRLAWSLFTQFSHGCLLSHFTLRCLQGQHAVPTQVREDLASK